MTVRLDWIGPCDKSSLSIRVARYLAIAEPRGSVYGAIPYGKNSAEIEHDSIYADVKTATYGTSPCVNAVII